MLKNIEHRQLTGKPIPLLQRIKRIQYLLEYEVYADDKQEIRAERERMVELVGDEIYFSYNVRDGMKTFDRNHQDFFPIGSFRH